MQRKKISVILFCIVSSVVMSSCMKTTANAIGTPVLNSFKTGWNCLESIFKGIGNTVRGKHRHTHTRKFCEVPPVEEAPAEK